MPATSRRAFAVLALGVAVASLVGCGSTPAPTAAPADQARQTLDSALGSWVQGKSIDAVKSASPSIIVEDPKWKQGVTLKSYAVQGEARPSGAEQIFTVTLTLTNTAGKETTEQADYRVGTSPILTVFRAIF